MASNSKKMVQCIHCQHGTFMQWFRNPVICQCSLHGERFVAEARRICDEYRSRSTQPTVVHYDKYE